MPKYEKGLSFKIRYDEKGELEVLKDPRPTVTEIVLKLQSMDDGPEKDRLSKVFNKHQNKPKYSRPFIQIR